MLRNVKDIRQTVSRGEDLQEWFVQNGRELTSHLQLASAQEPALASYGLRSVGWVIPGEGYAFVWVKPEWSLLYATVSGAGEVLIEGAWQRCEQGSAYLAPAGQVFGYRKLLGEDWQAVWVTLSDSTVLGVEPSRLVLADPTYLLYAVQGLYAEDSGRAEPSIIESYASLIAAHTRRIAQGSAQLSE